MPHFVAFLDRPNLITRPVGERVVSSSQRPLPAKCTPSVSFLPVIPRIKDCRPTP